METLQTINRTVEPIGLDNGLLLDGEAEKDVKGNYMRNNQQGWEQRYANTEKRFPTIAELVSGLRQSEQRQDVAALQGILQDMKEDWLCVGKLDYRNSNLPMGGGYLANLVKDPAWKRALENEIFEYDAPETIDMLQRVSGKQPYLLTPDASGRRSTPERAVWLLIDTDRFGLSCSNGPIYGDGRARGVREVDAAGARVGKSGSAYRNPAMTEEERLHSGIEEQLSRFDGFAGTYSRENYHKIKQEVAQSLKGLYKR